MEYINDYIDKIDAIKDDNEDDDNEDDDDDDEEAEEDDDADKDHEEVKEKPDCGCVRRKGGCTSKCKCGDTCGNPFNERERGML